MLRREIVIRIIVLLLLACVCCAQDIRKSGRPDAEARSTMAEILRRSPFLGSLEYSSTCADQPPPVLPRLLALPPNENHSALAMLRGAFADYPGMAVTQDSDGTIRMTEGNVPTDILSVKISRISFDDTSDPITAESIILSQPEIRSFMDAHHIRLHDDRFRFHEMRGLRIEPQPRMPHLSAELTNVTLRQVLDRLLKTFPGLWVYESCMGKSGGRIVALDYIMRG